MILGTERRYARPYSDDARRGVAGDAEQHRDLGRYLTPRIYPTAPFDPWVDAPVPQRGRLAEAV